MEDKARPKILMAIDYGDTEALEKVLVKYKLKKKLNTQFGYEMMYFAMHSSRFLTREILNCLINNNALIKSNHGELVPANSYGYAIYVDVIHGPGHVLYACSFSEKYGANGNLASNMFVLVTKKQSSNETKRYVSLRFYTRTEWTDSSHGLNTSNIWMAALSDTATTDATAFRGFADDLILSPEYYPLHASMTYLKYWKAHMPDTLQKKVRAYCHAQFIGLMYMSPEYNRLPHDLMREFVTYII